MKKALIILLITIAGTVPAMAQDLFFQMNMNPATLAINATGKLEIDAGNGGNGTYVANSVRLQITMSGNGTITGLDATSDPRWTVFSGTPNVAGNTYFLYNTGGPFNDFEVASIKLDVKGLTVGGPLTITGRMLFIPGTNPLLGGAPNSGQGNADPSNDNGQTSLTVAAVVPIRFNDITAEPSDCSAKLKWSTAMEEDGTTFDVEYSPDGRNFVKVTTVAGHKNAAGSAYEYAYNQGNGKGYYRLKMGNADGGYAYSKVVNSNIKCNAKKVFIYPNPIRTDEILHVNISNFDGKVTGELLSAEGKKVLTKTLQNGSNLVTLTSLPQGNYNFKVTDDKGEMQNYKVVIVK